MQRFRRLNDVLCLRKRYLVLHSVWISLLKFQIIIKLLSTFNKCYRFAVMYILILSSGIDPIISEMIFSNWGCDWINPVLRAICLLYRFLIKDHRLSMELNSHDDGGIIHTLKCYDIKSIRYSFLWAGWPSITRTGF